MRDVEMAPPCEERRPELLAASAALAVRGLAEGARWAAEMAEGAGPLAEEAVPLATGFDCPPELHAKVAMARSLLGMREYQRAARTLAGDACTACPLALFLRSYATYLSGEKRRNEQGHEVQDPVEKWA